MSRQIMITYNGITLSVRGWSRRLGIPYKTLYARIRRWPLELAMTEKLGSVVNPTYPIEYNGVTASIAQHARLLNIPKNRVYWRIAKHNETPQQALDYVMSTPIERQPWRTTEVKRLHARLDRVIDEVCLQELKRMLPDRTEASIRYQIRQYVVKTNRSLRCLQLLE